MNFLLSLLLCLFCVNSGWAQNLTVSKIAEIKQREGYLYFHTWQDANYAVLVIDEISFKYRSWGKDSMEMQSRDIERLLPALREAQDLIGKRTEDTTVALDSTSPGWRIDLKTSPVGDWIEWHTSVLRGEDRGSIITLTPQELAQVISIMKTVHDTLPVTHIP